MCYNLNHKQYCIENVQYTKEAYEQKKADYLSRASWDKFREFILGAIRKDCNIINGENCLGNNIFNAQDVHSGCRI
jgi:hypothetical protein